MHAQRLDNGMDAGFAELSLHILGSYIAVMAGVAVLFLGGVVEQTLPATGAVGIVAVFTAIGRNRLFGGVRPGIGRISVPRPGGDAVAALIPRGQIVAGHTKRRGGVVDHEEFGVLIVMRVMAGSALKLAVAIQANATGAGGAIEMPVGRDQRGIVLEGNWVVVGKVCAEVVGAAGHRGCRGLHGNLSCPAPDLAQRDGAIMATEAHLGSAGWLANSRFEGGTLVGGVSYGGVVTVPQGLVSPGVRRVAENANIRVLICRRDGGGQAAGAAGGEVVL